MAVFCNTFTPTAHYICKNTLWHSTKPRTYNPTNPLSVPCQHLYDQSEGDNDITYTIQNMHKNEQWTINKYTEYNSVIQFL
jgi:hypothetical protein